MTAAMSLEGRMKAREAAVGCALPPKMPAVLRVDGRAFHTLTRGFDRPFDATIEDCIERVALALCAEIGTATLAYCQSDEVSVLLVDYPNPATEQWFGGRRSKMESVAASVATAAFSEGLYAALGTCADAVRADLLRSRLFRAHFDARAFPVPVHDAPNYFLWRQRDAVRNSVMAAGRAVLPHRRMHGMRRDGVLAALREAGSPWEDLPTRQRRGLAVVRRPTTRAAPDGGAVEGSEWFADTEPPDFGDDRGYVASRLGAD